MLDVQIYTQCITLLGQPGPMKSILTLCLSIYTEC